MVKATATATWRGNWKQGDGKISTKKGILTGEPYSFASRFEDAKGASPEELLAAGYAGCFNQAIANAFGFNHFEAESVETVVDVSFDYNGTEPPAIAGLHVEVTARVPGIDQTMFQHCAERAKQGCAIARILNCDVSMTATLAD